MNSSLPILSSDDTDTLIGRFAGRGRDWISGLKSELEKVQLPASTLVDATGIYFNDREDILELLLSMFPDLEVESADGMTPLCFAAAHGASRCTAFLIARGANINHATGDGETPLWLSVYANETVSIQASLAMDSESTSSSRARCLEQLLTAGANTEIADRKRQTPLIVGSVLGYWPSVEALLKAGADPGARDGRGRTALLGAMDAASLPCATALLAAGSDISATDKDGLGAEDYLRKASQRGHDVSELAQVVRAKLHEQKLGEVATGPAVKARM